MTSQPTQEAPLLLVVCAEPAHPAPGAQSLARYGFRTDFCRPGLPCMEALRATPPAAVVLSTDLNESEAIELCRALRAVPEGRDLPILMGLTELDDGVVRKARDAGASEFLSERLCPSLVEHRIRRVLSHRASVRDGERIVSATEAGSDAGLSSAAILRSSEAFVDRLSGVLPRAQAQGANVAVLVAELSKPGFELPEVDHAEFCDLILDRMRQSLEDLENESYRFKGIVRIAPMAWSRYAIMLPELERVQDASKLAGRLQESLSVPIELQGEAVDFDANVGIAIYPSDAVGAKGLLERAQTACYYASQDSATGHWFYAESMNRWAFERLTLEQNLREALTNNELSVYYQPRVDVNSQRVVGMEALVRWIHPKLGVISPGQFIPLAEESGLIVPLGEWVLREACRQNKEWQDAGLPPVRVSVNLSAVQFRKSDLFDVVSRAVQDTGLDTQWLELELTESMLMRDPKATIETLHRLKEIGIHLSVDDFGTGYSSLSYLKRFPIDALKIDQSFVSEITTNPDDAAIATTIILMGHSLRLDVVAEGVETESQLSFLSVLQCNEVQGFLFSPPVPADKARELIGVEMAHAFA